MRMEKQIKFIFRIHVPQMADPPDRLLHPVGKLHLPALIFQVIADDPREFTVIGAALLIPLYIFLHYHFIGQRLIRRLQDDPSEIAAFMKLIYIQEIFQPVGIADELLRGDPGGL